MTPPYVRLIASVPFSSVIEKGPSKRGASYAKFSKFATHASIEGFEMLKPRGADWAAVGPFMDIGMLRALLEEHAKLALQAGMAFNLFLHIDSLPARQIAYRMIWGMMDWMERYHGASYSAEERARTQALPEGD